MRDPRDQELVELHGKWVERLQQLRLPGGEPVKDGALYPEAYWSKPERRVLFVLRDPNDEGENDMRERVENNMSTTWRGMVALATVALGGELPERLSWSRDQGLAVFSTVAIINAKKAKGIGKSTREEIGGHMWGCADLLRDQVALLAPAILIFAATTTGLSSVLSLPEEPDFTAKRASGWKHEGRIYVGTHHPSASMQGRGFVEDVGAVLERLGS